MPYSLLIGLLLQVLSAFVCTAENAAEAQEQSPTQMTEPKGKGKKRLINVGTNSNAFNLGASESMIAWERWHRVVGKALHKRVERANRTSMGEVVLLVTVTKELAVTALVLNATSPKMAENCKIATESLSGDTDLLFPQDSKRGFIKFRFEYKRGFFFIPKNHYITDDFEPVDETTNGPVKPMIAPASTAPASIGSESSSTEPAIPGTSKIEPSSTTSAPAR